MKKILIIIALMWALLSCSDNILNISPKDRIAEDVVWTDQNLINAYHTELYNCIQHGFKIHMQSKATDEAVCTITFDIGLFSIGAITPDNITAVENTAWNGGGNIYYWDTGWQYIRKINIFLEKMGSTNLNINNKARLVAEAKFLRAYIYFEFIKRFGGVPIINQSYELGATVTFTRDSFDDCVKFIETNLTEAIPDLPEKYDASDANFGRASQDVCQALLSRLYLYVASPLWNPSHDLQKWQKAADAAAALLNKYSLYPDYTKLFNQPSGTANSELIWAREFSSTNYQSEPPNNLGRRYGAYGGWWASNGPSQNLVDDYDMTNGEPPFIWVNGVKTNNPASGYNPQHPYKNRDPRFEATVIHDSAVYHGDLHEMWIASDGNSWGFDSYKQSGDNPRCDYILRKFMPGIEEPISWQYPYTQPWPIFRLGEIYLNYAEAKFELGDEATCRDYLSRIRARVGMPAIPASVTGENLRARLYNERRVEMAFEEQRFWDLRRWKIASDVENRPMYGMQIIKDVNTGVKTYTPVLLLSRLFLDKMYLLPIATDEIRKNNSSLIQTTGW